MFLVLEPSTFICIEGDIYHGSREEVMYYLHRTAEFPPVCCVLVARGTMEGVSNLVLVVGTTAQDFYLFRSWRRLESKCIMGSPKLTFNPGSIGNFFYPNFLIWKE